MVATWTHHASPPTDAVTVLLAGPPQRVAAWYAALMNDPRFSITTRAVSLLDLQAKLAGNPEILLLDASMLPGPKELFQLLTQVQTAAYLLIPLEAGKDTQLIETLRQTPVVKGLYVGDVNLPELAGRMYGDALALRESIRPGMEAIWTVSGESGIPTGLRIIAVWNQMGGVGKTTLASNLAYEASRRGIPTLLIGLGAPDDLPLILGLKAEPNLTHWRANPTESGFKNALQRLDNLHVLAGFPDVLSEAQTINTPPEAPYAISKLVLSAAYAGYAAIILDAPPTALAASAIAAANHLVLVARPSLEGVMRTAEAYHTVVERLAGQHRIPATGVHVVLCRTGDRLSASEWHKAASAQIGRGFPPVIAQIPDDPLVGQAQDQRRMPLVVSDAFARGLRPLADTLFALPVGGDNGSTPRKKVINLGFVKVKI